MNNVMSVLGQIVISRIKVCLIYKKNFVLNFFFNCVWTFVQIIFINLIFANTNSIMTWNKYEIMLYFGIDEVIFPLFVMISFSSFQKLEQMINDGTIDYVLLQPINEKIFLSFHNLDLFQVPTILFGVFLILFSLNNLNKQIPTGNIIMFIILLSTGLWLLCSMFIICVSLVFKYRKLNFLKDILLSVISCMSYPLNIYQGLFKIFITIIVPIGIIVDFPAQILLRHLNWTAYLWSFSITIIFFILQNVIWNKMLQQYTSSSS